MIQLSLAKRICYHYPYVMLAAALSADAVDGEDTSSLHADASNEGICFFRVIRSFDDGCYLVRVAARLELLSEGYTVVLDEGQLAYALPWDCRLQGKSTGYIHKILHAHHASLQPPYQKTGIIVKPQDVPESVSLSDTCIAEAGSMTPGCKSDTLPLPHVFISEADYWQALAMTQPLKESLSKGHRSLRCKIYQRRWLERVMLHAALVALEKALLGEQSGLRRLFKEMQLMIKQVEAFLYSFHKPLVHVSAVSRNQRQLGWYVQIDVPRMLANAA